jgi:site-specific DNA-methyltransferase (adenine-specific)
VLKSNGSLWISGTYHSIYQCGFILQKNDWHLINDICWLKPNAPPNLSCRMFTASHETLLWAKKKKASKHTFHYDLVRSGFWEKDPLKSKDKQMRSVWCISAARKDEKRYGKHPTQKPEALLERIIKASTNDKDIVLDPFCGSGTTGVSALRNNRIFIGIDAHEPYLTKMVKPRLDDEVSCRNNSINNK